MSVTKETRAAELRAAWERFIKVHEAWQKDTLDFIPQSYIDAANELVDAYHERHPEGDQYELLILRDCPRELLPLGRVATVFGYELDGFVNQANERMPKPGRVNYRTKMGPPAKTPRTELYAAIERAKELLAKTASPALKPLESIVELMRQHVSPSQIAMIYDLPRDLIEGEVKAIESGRAGSVCTPEVLADAQRRREEAFRRQQVAELTTA